DADPLAQKQARPIADEAGEEVAAEGLGRRQAAEIRARPALVLVVALHAVEEPGDPGGSALGERDLELRIALQRSTPEEVGRARKRVPARQRHLDVDRSIGAADEAGRRRGNVNREHDALIDTGREEWIPRTGVNAREPERLGVLA